MAFIVAFTIPQKPLMTFLYSFSSIFFLWAGLSFRLSYNNDHILAHKISLLILMTDWSLLIILLTGFIGGLVAGIGALAGSFLRKKRG